MKSRKKEPYYVSLDSEDDGKGNPYLFVFVSADFRSSFDCANDARIYLGTLGRSYSEKGFKLYLWCTNLEYDLVNLFGDSIHLLRLRFSKASLVGAEWPQYGILFRDTLRHIPASVRDLGDMVGLKKIEDKKRGKAYSFRDAAITLKGAEVIRGVYSSFDLEPKSTLPSTAYHIWRNKFWEGSDPRLPDSEVLEASRYSYYGGHTEALAIGEHRNVRVIDASSMFPYCMIGEFPLPWGRYERIHKGSEIEAFGVYRCRVKCYVARPLFPIRTERGTIYPNGCFDGWYTGEELLYFRGGREGIRRIEVLEGYRFLESCIPFTDYVGTFFKLKQNSKGAMRTMFKLLLNGLYGKFGQRGETIKAVPASEYYEGKWGDVEARIWCGLALFTQITDPPAWANVVWSSFVTSRARIRLHRELERIRESGGTPLYCDTDSVIYRGCDLAYPEKALKPGDFESRGSYKKVLIVGKKEYGLQATDGTWEHYCKGIPYRERERYLRTGEATYVKPVRMRESARIGIRANIWKSVTKKRRVSFKDRHILSNGVLLPIVVGQ